MRAEADASIGIDAGKNSEPSGGLQFVRTIT
jgi:hypothetical protein